MSKSNPYKNLTFIELQTELMRCEASLRNIRIQTVLKKLARTKNKDINVQRHEANLEDSICKRYIDRIDEALERLEIYLDINYD